MASGAHQQNQLLQEINQASSTAIHDAMPRLVQNWEKGLWLKSGNRYRAKSVEQIRNDMQTSGSLQHSDMTEYVAASAIVHCFDGWSFLGHALHAEIAGDPDTARHLGYYAELRAAMSLLASGGVGVFNNRHVLVADNGTCAISQCRKPTHEFAWDALQAWADTSAAHDAFLQAIQPGGFPLFEWFAKFSIGSQFLPRNWPQKWGLDLARLAMDRAARNISSYRPTALATPGARPIKDIMNGIFQLWEACDPDSNGGFPILDRHLLRRSIASVWQDQIEMRNVESYQHQLIAVLDGIGLTEYSKSFWREFLSHNKLIQSHGLISEASKTDDVNHLDHSRQVLARGTLLLRLATGCSAILLREAGTDVESALDFWRSSRSVRRNLWLRSESLTSSADLWSDVEDAVSSIKEWLDSRGESACRYSLWKEEAVAATTLVTTERAFLWGVGL